MLFVAKNTYYLLAVLIFIAFCISATDAQDRYEVQATQDNVSITIVVSRSNLADATKEAKEVQAAMPAAVNKILHKPVNIKYLPTKVTIKQIGKTSQYQVTVVGSGGSRK